MTGSPQYEAPLKGFCAPAAGEIETQNPIASFKARGAYFLVSQLTERPHGLRNRGQLRPDGPRGPRPWSAITIFTAAGVNPPSSFGACRHSALTFEQAACRWRKLMSVRRHSPGRGARPDRVRDGMRRSPKEPARSLWSCFGTRNRWIRSSFRWETEPCWPASRAGFAPTRRTPRYLVSAQKVRQRCNAHSRTEP